MLLQLFRIPGPFRDIGQRNSDETKIPMNLTLYLNMQLLICASIQNYGIHRIIFGKN